MSTATSAAQRRGLLDRMLGRPARGDASTASASTPAYEDLATPVAVRPTPEDTPRVRHTWSSLVARVRDVTKATAVLAIDDQGLVVAATGDLPQADLDGVAAHVALAFDLFERLAVLGKKTESVCAQYVPDGTWLTAIRMRPPVGRRMTIGIVGPYTLARDDRRRIRDAFASLFDEATEA
jgi:hypothetical protein